MAPEGSQCVGTAGSPTSDWHSGGMSVLRLGQLFEATFGRPRGALGRVGAAVMVRANAERESWAVDQAQLTPGANVLVVGHGPGVGLAEPEEAARAAGFTDVRTSLRTRKRNGPAVELLGRVPG